VKRSFGYFRAYNYMKEKSHVNVVMDFYIRLAVHLGIIFVNNQHDVQFFFVYVYFYSLHVSGGA
jgi:hypothetical protein